MEGSRYTCDSDFWNVVLFLCLMIILAEVPGNKLLFWPPCMFYQIGYTRQVVGEARTRTQVHRGRIICRSGLRVK